MQQTLIKKIFSHLRWRLDYTRMKIYLFSRIGVYEVMISPFLKKELSVGLFKGMVYKNTSIGSVLLPKLYGTYEREIQKFITELDLNQYDVFVDIGCADGYYLAGIASISGINKIIGYDPAEQAQHECFRLISDNSLLKDRFEVKGLFEQQDFEPIIQKYQHPLFLIDVDGYEKELFKNIPVSMFSTCSFLVETHEFIHPSIVHELTEYFKPSHRITTVKSNNGQDNVNLVNGFHPYVKRKRVAEHRPGPQSYLKILPQHDSIA